MMINVGMVVTRDWCYYGQISYVLPIHPTAITESSFFSIGFGLVPMVMSVGMAVAGVCCHDDVSRDNCC